MIKKIILGIIAGIICGLFSAGGGLILVPAFVYVLKLNEVKARATSLFAILPMVIVSGVFYFKQDYMNWHIGILCAIGGIVGGIMGAKFLKRASVRTLKIIFIFFLVYASIKMTFF